MHNWARRLGRLLCIAVSALIASILGLLGALLLWSRGKPYLIFDLTAPPPERSAGRSSHRCSELPGPSPCPINLTLHKRSVDISHVEALRFRRGVVPMSPGSA